MGTYNMTGPTGTGALTYWKVMEHWLDLFEEADKNGYIRGKDIGIYECEFCLNYHHNRCVSCPIAESTQVTRCEGSPYVGVEEIVQEIEDEFTDGINERATKVVRHDYTTDLLIAIESEYRFLADLLFDDLFGDYDHEIQKENNHV